MRLRALLVVVLAVLVAPCDLALTACRSPTDITVVVTTDFGCNDLHHTTVSVGTLGDAFEALPATSTSTTCTGDGYAGRVVVIPSGGADALVGIKVVGGFGTKNAEDCAPKAGSNPPDYGRGCIVARRALKYVSHKPLTVPIVLRASCDGVACGATETCVQGNCVPARIDDPNQCASPAGCGEVPIAPDAGSISPVAGCDMRGLQPGAPWPVEGYCPSRLSRSPFIGAQSNALVFKTNIGPVTVPSCPSIAADGTIYIHRYEQRDLLAIDPKTGGVKWSVGTGFLGASPPTLAADGLIYVAGSFAWQMLAFDASGKQVKDLPTTGQTFPPLFVASGNFVLMEGGSIVERNAAWSAVWTTPLGATSTSPIAVAPSGVILSGWDDGHVWALDAASGAKLWSFTDSRGFGTPVVGRDGTVYATASSLSALDPPTTGSQAARRWSFSPAAGSANGLAIGPDGTLYLGSDNHKLYAIDPKGNERWEFATGGAIQWGPSVDADGTVYFGSDDGNFYAVDARGAEKWRIVTGSSVRGCAAIAQHLVVFESTNGYLYAVGP